VNEGDVYVPFPFTDAVVVLSTVVQVGLFTVVNGPYSFQVIDPVGLEPPDNVAWSEIDPPIEVEVATVEIEGCTGETVEVSLASPHAPDAGLLFVSPP
jgi:hypothetical protein